MRKKYLLQQNISLFEQLNSARWEISSLTSDLEAANKRIEELSKALETQKTAQEETQSQKSVAIENLEKKIVSIDSVTDFAAEVIGQIVVDSTKYANELTNDGEVRYKELVNLILGRTEVAKSEILSVVSEDISFDQKKEKINVIKEDAFEYFKSVMAQRS